MSQSYELSSSQSTPLKQQLTLPLASQRKSLFKFILSLFAGLFSGVQSCVEASVLLEDFRIIFKRDPAARNALEVLFCYPGATIGRGVFIDHGMGVVIGETAIVGDYTLIYQGVTLGGTGKETGKRHPTLGSHVVVGAGAKILGNIHVGDYARVGAGSIVLRPVPANCTAVGVPGRNLCRTNTRKCPLEHGELPDAEATIIRTLVERIEQLEEELQMLKSQTLNLSRSQDDAPAF